MELPWNEIIERDVSIEDSEDRINYILIYASIISSFILLGFLIKILLVLPITPNSLSFTRLEGDSFQTSSHA